MMVHGQDELAATKDEIYWPDCGAFDNPSTAIVEVVAETLDRDQTDLDALYDHVDGDAVDTLLCDANTRIELSFEYEGVHVTADSTGRIEVTQQP